MTDWEKIRREYETSKITMKDLAKKHKVNYATLRSRKSREDWQRGVATNDATNNKTQKGSSAKKQGAPKGNQNAKGNTGGGAPRDNKNAVSHGLFANWLPDESLAIINEVSQMTPEDMIWQNILIQYTAIIRAQKIMHVANAHDDVNNLTGLRLDPELIDETGKPVRIEEKREWHMAYQKQEAFMNAQSRAMSTLSNLIKQFVALADDDDKRKLELQTMEKRLTNVELENKRIENELEPAEDSENLLKDYMTKLKDVYKDES